MAQVAAIAFVFSFASFSHFCVLSEFLMSVRFYPKDVLWTRRAGRLGLSPAINVGKKEAAMPKAI